MYELSKNFPEPAIKCGQTVYMDGRPYIYLGPISITVCGIHKPYAMAALADKHGNRYEVWAERISLTLQNQ